MWIAVIPIGIDDHKLPHFDALQKDSIQHRTSWDTYISTHLYADKRFSESVSVCVFVCVCLCVCVFVSAME